MTVKIKGESACIAWLSRDDVLRLLWDGELLLTEYGVSLCLFVNFIDRYAVSELLRQSERFKVIAAVRTDSPPVRG
jgi:hypothetical protein